MRSRLTFRNRRLRAAGLRLAAGIAGIAGGAGAAGAQAADAVSVAFGAAEPAFLAGAAAVLLLSSLLRFFASRERAFLDHALMTLGVTVGTNVLAPHAAPIAPLAGFALAGLFAAQLTRRYFESAAHAPRLDRALRLAAVVFAAVLAGTFVLPSASVGIVVAGAGLLFGLFALGVGLSRRPSAAAALFVVGWIAIVAGIALAGALTLGWMPDGGLAAHALEIGSTIGLLMLSVGVAERGQSALRELVRSHAESLAANEHVVESLQASEQALTQGIAQRSQELEAANRRLQESEQRLQTVAYEDPLTGLANRLLLGDRVTRAIVRAKRHNCRTAIVLVGLDDFTRVNSAFGEAVGDEVLKLAAARLRRIVREQDTVARVAGDEFVIVLEEVFDAQDVQRVATGAATEVAQAYEVLGQTVTIGASLGWALYPDGGADGDALLRQAARQMRRVKRAKASRRAAANPAQAA